MGGRSVRAERRSVTRAGCPERSARSDVATACAPHVVVALTLQLVLDKRLRQIWPAEVDAAACRSAPGLSHLEI
jgi:hypothetical protein